jgi:hypothetical protein
MPQLAKGGKNAFGWSVVSEIGTIVIPPDAFEEYMFMEGGRLILISGSRTSGGFGLARMEMLAESPLSGFLSAHPELAEFRITPGQPVKHNSKTYTWVNVTDKSINVPNETLQLYGIKPGDHLLTVRGSNLALGFIVRGPIIEEARKHPELDVFE